MRHLRHLPSVVVTLLLLSGCASTNPNKPPRYAESVQVVPFDSSPPRDVNPNFQVFARESDVRRPFKIIALVGRCAKPNDQGLMLTAIAWRAKQLGADGMIILEPERVGSSFTATSNFAIGGPGEPFYRAHAIVFTSSP